MKLNTVIYIPDKGQAEEMQKYVAAVLFQADYGATITTCISTGWIHRMIKENGHKFDLLMLPADRDGYALGDMLRKVNRSCAIVYVTADMKNVLYAFRTMPIAYITGDSDLKHLSAAVLRAAKWAYDGKKMFYHESKTQLIQLSYDEIDYFESEYRVVHIHKQNGGLETITAKLDEVQAQLPQSIFIRCHKSYLVNLNHIRKVDKSAKTVELNSGAVVYISKALYPEFIRIVSRGDLNASME